MFNENTSNWTWIFVFAVVMAIGALGYKLLTFQHDVKPIPAVTFDPKPWNDTIADLRGQLELSALEQKQLQEYITYNRTHEHTIVSHLATPWRQLSPAAVDSVIVFRHLGRADSLRATGAGIGAVAFR